MERISLPTRTVSTRTVVVLPVGAAVIVGVLAFVAAVLYYDLAAYYMRDFRRVVITGRNVVEMKGGELRAEWTLFESGGVKHALRSEADRAYDRMDTWNAQMRTTYVRALWREFNGPVDREGVTPGQFARSEIPQFARQLLEQAVRSDPTNRFYRATLCGVLMRLQSTPEIESRIDELLTLHPPQNAYAQVWLAETLQSRGADKPRILVHYYRALELVSSDVNSGLVDLSRAQPGVTPPDLGPALVAQAVDGMLKNVGSYDVWADQLPDYPEVHWMVASHLRTRGKTTESQKELDQVVTSVRRRLTREAEISTLGSLASILVPLSRPDISDRFLFDREIGYAAGVLRGANQPEEATRMYEVLITRSPGDMSARLALGELLLARAEALRIEARDAREGGQAQKATEIEAKVTKLYQDVDAQASAILRIEPRMSAALDLRARIPREKPAP